MRFFTTLASVLVSAAAFRAVSAHDDHDMTAEELVEYRRNFAVSTRELHTRCGSQIAARRAKRHAERRRAAGALGKRAILPRDDGLVGNNASCQLTPEVTQGPYHILGELVRQNITQGQGGVPLQVEADFVDYETCEPVIAWIDAWHANATGYYSGYIAETGSALSGGGGFSGAGGSGPGGDNSSMSITGSMSMMPTATGGNASTTTSASYDYTSGADSTSAGSMLDTDVDDEENFLRGAFYTDPNGHLTMYSIVPGWYSGRAPHFHIKVYPEGYLADNGSFFANGSAVHTGQFFFDMDFYAEVAALSPYSSNSISWENATKNADDQWYPYQSAEDYNADMEITYIGETLQEGVIGEIVVGLNMSWQSPQLSTQWWVNNSTDSD
ncbi:aromatic compound dioxygenase [Punctularia strigosozonata HHB-11173 SS5]|uniref:aromatic compound dioxygenase n=1 Tax=Punctularia strigosozonata (strain HHB-11173) TaxID=741275 RepID=UPI0004417463|nr:aromatic compound dioxygenase [Punctularia strigosozonata HHB-11173 SS5]EIN11702.1 aromatic compound dioxygenase [Punctularia strigosozonata HHB-11173 SS5]